jgi:DNA-directed RNA polymerase subunit RPC12/RpoP
MTPKSVEPDMEAIVCPACGSDALYRYGRASGGKRRFLCLMCNRQFVIGSNRNELTNRPNCPKCGKKMHCYMREEGLIRFRCSDYPKCRTYIKLKIPS